MATEWDIDDQIKYLAVLPIKRFYPTIVAKQTGLPLQVVFEYLLELASREKPKLQLKWEIRCPNYYCARTLYVLDSFPTNLDETIYCKYCGKEFNLSIDIIFPAFIITPEYKNYIKENTKKKRYPSRFIKKHSSRFKSRSFIFKCIRISYRKIY